MHLLSYLMFPYKLLLCKYWLHTTIRYSLMTMSRSRISLVIVYDVTSHLQTHTVHNLYFMLIVVAFWPSIFRLTVLCQWLGFFYLGIRLICAPSYLQRNKERTTCLEVIQNNVLFWDLSCIRMSDVLSSILGIWQIQNFLTFLKSIRL